MKDWNSFNFDDWNSFSWDDWAVFPFQWKTFDGITEATFHLLQTDANYTVGPTEAIAQDEG